MKLERKAARILVVVGWLALVCGGCGGGQTAVSQRDIGPFHSMEISGPLALVVEAAEESSVRLTGGRGTVAVEDGVLVVEPAGGAALDLRVATPDLGRIAVSGDGDVRIDLKGLALSRLELSVRGAGKVRVAGVDAERLRLEADTDADVRIAGRALRLEVVGAGAGNLDLAGLCTESADVELQDGTTARVVATTRIDARLAPRAALAYFAPHELGDQPGKVERLADAGACER